MPDVYLLLLEYGQEREQAALALLEPVLHRAFPDTALRITIVDNALAGDVHATIDARVDRISGDNTLREFSGLDRGLGWLDRRYAPPPGAIVVLANDTVARADKIGRVRNLPAGRAVEALGGALVGWVDEYPRPVRLFGAEFRQWVDTSLIIAQRRTFALLEPLAVSPTAEEVFDNDWRQLFRNPSPLSENYRAYLRTYFLGDRLDAEFKHGWYAQAPVTDANFEAIKTKVRCVLCEHQLSVRARARGIPLVDIRPDPLPIDPWPAVDVVAR